MILSFNNKERLSVFFATVSGLFLVFSWFGWLKQALPFDAAWVAIVLSGAPILSSAFSGLIRRGDIKAGVLVSIALVASVAIKEYFAADTQAFDASYGEEILKAQELHFTLEDKVLTISMTNAAGNNYVSKVALAAAGGDAS